MGGLAEVTDVRSVAALEAGSEEGTRFFLDTVATTTKRGVELQRQLQERVADDPQAKAHRLAATGVTVVKEKDGTILDATDVVARHLEPCRAGP